MIIRRFLNRIPHDIVILILLNARSWLCGWHLTILNNASVDGVQPGILWVEAPRLFNKLITHGPHELLLLLCQRLIAIHQFVETPKPHGASGGPVRHSGPGKSLVFIVGILYG